MPILNKAYDSINDKFKPIVYHILQELEGLGYQPIVAEGLRTKAQQEEKVRKGYSKTMNSYHLSGCAVDIVDKRYMWDKGLVNAFWWNLYQVAKKIKVDGARLRFGIVWDHPEREALYKKALDDLREGKITQGQADARINYFCDVAHVEIHFDK